MSDIIQIFEKKLKIFFLYLLIISLPGVGEKKIIKHLVFIAFAGMTSKSISAITKETYLPERAQHVGSFSLDKELSNRRVAVYADPDGKVVVSHRGTQGKADWLNNAKYVTDQIFGTQTYKNSKRYANAKKIQNQAEKKYGVDNVLTIGHSQGGLLAREVAHSKIVSINPAYFLEEPNSNELIIRSNLDPISVGAEITNHLPGKSKKHNIQHIEAKTNNIFAEHSSDILDN